MLIGYAVGSPAMAPHYEHQQHRRQRWTGHRLNVRPPVWPWIPAYGVQRLSSKATDRSIGSTRRGL